MKLYVGIIMLIGFAGVAIFGAFAMGHGESSGYSLCIAATAKGTVCPETSAPFMVADFYLSVIKSFSLAIFGTSPATTLLAAALLMAILLTLLAISATSPVPRPTRYAIFPDLDSTPAFLTLRLIPWLALHENSPQFSPAVR